MGRVTARYPDDHRIEDFATDWWRVPIGGGTTHWCPTCAKGQIEELLDAGSWTVEVQDVPEPCEVCGTTPDPCPAA
jgi:hypothetical protein